jgi:hypothetical protein
MTGGCSNETKEERPVVAEGLTLNGFTLVEGTDVFRADLQGHSSSLSCGCPGKVNILFLDPNGVGRWLVEDNLHYIEEQPIVDRQEAGSSAASSTIAIAVLVRLRDNRSSLGKLILIDPPGRRIVSVADQVRDICGVALVNSHLGHFDETTEMAVIYEQGAHYMRASFNPSTLAKLREVQVTWPALKGIEKHIPTKKDSGAKADKP